MIFHTLNCVLYGRTTPNGKFASVVDFIFIVQNNDTSERQVAYLFLRLIVFVSKLSHGFSSSTPMRIH